MVAGEGSVRAPEVRQEAPRADRNAVLGSAAASRAREANRADDLDEMERMALDAAQVPGGPSAGMRVAVGQQTGITAPELKVVSGRAFVLRDGVWVDRTHAPDAHTADVMAFSPAYFELLRALPGLEVWLSQFSNVVVAGEKLSLRITEDGDATLSARQIQRIARDFRGA